MTTKKKKRTKVLRPQPCARCRGTGMVYGGELLVFPFGSEMKPCDRCDGKRTIK